MPYKDFEGLQIARPHFIGIGGVGMSGIASVAKQLGMQVSGSDLKESKYSKALRAQGIDVAVGHQAVNIKRAQPDVVVVSSAIPDTNPELVAAREQGIPVWPRAKMLAYVSRAYKLVAVAGTHGKTTTSSMMSSALVHLGVDPTFLVGGILGQFESNARYGKGEWCVVEADESDGSFIFLDPRIAIVTNIEEDHLDHYADLQEIQAAFADFVSGIPADGCVIVCGDGQSTAELMRASTKANVISYGQSDGCDVKVVPGQDGWFDADIPGWGTVHAKPSVNPGVHNMLNATAVLIALAQMGFDAQQGVEAIQAFSGVHRRFDLVGQQSGVTVIDDYGHHPTEIAATIAAAREKGYQRIHVLFQPHRYTRTARLAQLFGTAFDQADCVTVMDVYSAGETPIPGVTGKTVVDAVKAHDPDKDIQWVSNRAQVVSHLMQVLQPGDLLLTMGAGDVTAMGPSVLVALRERDS